MPLASYLAWFNAPTGPDLRVWVCAWAWQHHLYLDAADLRELSAMARAA